MSSELEAIFLTEAGATSGFGHLTRCVALYDALASLRCKCGLVVSGEAPCSVVGTRTRRFQDWRNPEAAQACVSGFDIVVVDSYVADIAVYRAIAEAVPVAVYFDDTARLRYPRGFVVNGNPDAPRLAFRTSQDAALLLGVQYQPVRAEFISALQRTARPRVERVLVVSGGSDVGGTRDLLSTAAKDSYPGAHVDVVESPRTAVEMADAMLRADVALSAAGQTLYELAATGTPTIAVCVAENQVAQALALHRVGAIRLSGQWGKPVVLSTLVAQLGSLELRDARAEMSASARALVDGQGASRVARSCVASALVARIELRCASASDERALLMLENEASVRRTAFRTDHVDPVDHHVWFAERLADPEAMLLLAWDQDVLVGYVRFARVRTIVFVSIALAPDYRGFGLGGLVLERGMDRLMQGFSDVRFARAEVRPENTASVRVFERAGFSHCVDSGADDRVVLERRL